VFPLILPSVNKRLSPLSNSLFFFPSGGGAGSPYISGAWTNPGEEAVVFFKAIIPGMFIYHVNTIVVLFGMAILNRVLFACCFQCAGNHVPNHIAHGQYG
jgi:hypothetical protein